MVLKITLVIDSCCCVFNRKASEESSFLATATSNGTIHYFQLHRKGKDVNCI